MSDNNSLLNWKPCGRPGNSVLVGDYAVCEPYQQSRHSTGLFTALGGLDNTDLWAFMPFGPFEAAADIDSMLAHVNPEVPTEGSWQTMVIRCAATTEILGVASYMRIREVYGSAEVGAVAFSKKLQRTRIASDAMYLMARHVFDDLGYRRYEWKCHHANDASKRAAIRFGFQYEGVFRNDMIVKGKNRDTVWYAMTDDDWPLIHTGFKAWLAPENFGSDGNQRHRMETLRCS